jgi:2-polyprenyl-3-methyl-5-hydroxy-6-metoxy-1,4-benzoquinol methylase
VTDLSNGYDAVAAEFIRRRANPQPPAIAIGAKQVSEWARSLSVGATVLDLGCGPGVPLTDVLVRAGLDVHAVDASPTLVAAFRKNLPGVPIACEAVEDSKFFDQSFDAVMAWGLMFLLDAAEQSRLIGRVAAILRPAGRLLFTSPDEAAVWNDAMTGRESTSLGAKAYREILASSGLRVVDEYEDEGQNHYFDARQAAG